MVHTCNYTFSTQVTPLLLAIELGIFFPKVVLLVHGLFYLSFQGLLLVHMGSPTYPQVVLLVHEVYCLSLGYVTFIWLSYLDQGTFATSRNGLQWSPSYPMWPHKFYSHMLPTLCYLSLIPRGAHNLVIMKIKYQQLVKLVHLCDYVIMILLGPCNIF